MFSGHGVIMGKVKRHWQDFEWLLGLFDDRLGVARRRYKAFVAKGICEGRRDDLTERKRVAARSLLCYLAIRDLGIGMAQIARRLNRNSERIPRRFCLPAVLRGAAGSFNLSLAGVSQSVKRRETKGYNLIDP
jgi:hypothetical protein